MRLAYLTTEFVTEDYYSGGLANYLHRLGRSLTRAGHEVHVLTYSDHKPGSFQLDGMCVHRMKEGGRIEKQLNRISRYRRMTSAKFIDFSYQCYRKLRELEAEGPLDCIQTTNYQFPGLFSGWLLKTPQVLRLTSYSPVWHEKADLPLDSDMRLMQKIEDFQIKHSRWVFTPSLAVAKMVQRRIGSNMPKVIPSPFELEIPPEKWDDEIYRKLNKSGSYLLFFGRFQAHKGFLILVEALNGALGALPTLRAVFVGQDANTCEIPSTRAYAQEQLARFGDRALFLEELRHHQLYPVIAGAKLVVLPSLVDNLPNAALEAMALGRPMIGTLGTSFEEMIEDGQSGFLTEAGNPEALMRVIEKAWEHPDLEEIGRQAQIDASRFTPDRCLLALLDLYNEAIQSKKKG